MAHNPKRLSRLRAVMGEQGIDVLYVRELSNISWATGFERVFDDEPAHALVVSAHNCVLHTDSRYFDAMKSAAADTDIEVEFLRIRRFELSEFGLSKLEKYTPTAVPKSSSCAVIFTFDNSNPREAPSIHTALASFTPTTLIEESLILPRS